MNPENPPRGHSPGAYDEGEALRQVFNQTLSKPSTLGTFLIGTAGALGVILFAPAWATFGGMVFAGGLVGGTWAWYRNYFGKRNVYLQQYHQQLHKQFEAARVAKLENLKSSLDAGANQCEQGRKQVDDLDESFQTISEILTRKLSQGELMYSRFLGMAEQVYLSGLRNLEKVITLMLSIQSTNIDELNRSIQELESLEKNTGLSAAQKRSLTALKKRKGLYDTAKADIDTLLAQNDEAITTLSETSSAIAHLDTEANSLSRSGIESEMQTLSEFIARHNGENAAEKISLKLD
jgi:predicted ribosome quality control (RQC) complex YloA/Tae2 family protein